jgi:hypothetical protein
MSRFRGLWRTLSLAQTPTKSKNAATFSGSGYFDYLECDNRCLAVKGTVAHGHILHIVLFQGIKNLLSSVHGKILHFIVIRLGQAFFVFAAAQRPIDLLVEGTVAHGHILHIVLFQGFKDLLSSVHSTWLSFF